MVSSIGTDHPQDHGFDTIAAIATAVAPGEGSVAIVRISGPGSEAIGQQLFVAPGSQGLGLQVLEALVHQVEGVINQLGRLLGGHGWARESWGRCKHRTQTQL